MYYGIPEIIGLAIAIVLLFVCIAILYKESKAMSEESFDENDSDID